MNERGSRLRDLERRKLNRGPGPRQRTGTTTQCARRADVMQSRESVHLVRSTSLHVSFLLHGARALPRAVPDPAPVRPSLHPGLSHALIVSLESAGGRRAPGAAAADG